MAEVTVVIVTRNRVETLSKTLHFLVNLPEKPPIIVVDNASTDGTPERIRMVFPTVNVIALSTNRGCSARNIGVEQATTNLVAFCDDDSYWQPGALSLAAVYFSRYPHVGVLAGKVLLGDSQELDPVCNAMKNSPLTDSKPLPGPAILGFMSCAVVVRRTAFLSVGGFYERFAIAGEERLFSVDIRTKGWSLAYAEELVAHHYPASERSTKHRIRYITRDTFWYYWLRRPVYFALRHSWIMIKAAFNDASVRKGIFEAFSAMPYILRQRKVVPPPVEEQLLKIESYY